MIAMTTPTSNSRRNFLKGGVGLVIGMALPAPARLLAAEGVEKSMVPATPNAFVRIAPDNTVTVYSKHIEFGQGPYTGLATLVAEELDADWSQIRVEAAPSDPETYKNFRFGIQGTGGSSAMANSYLQMRRAGAAARAMLVAAAARRWGVDEAGIEVSNGLVSHAVSGQSATFGELAEAARESAFPKDPKLKSPEDFELIGTDVPKVDSRAKSTGGATFTVDVYRDDMLTVVVAHPPKFGAKVARFDARKANAVAGVVKVAEIQSGIAVYAKNTYAAIEGRKALDIDWDESDAETRSTAQMFEAFREAAKGAGRLVEATGDIDEAIAGAERVLEAEYLFPYLAHAPLEPLDGVIEWRDGKAEVWMGSQLQTVDHNTMAAVLGTDAANIAIHTMFAGGSFGRRAQPGGDFAAEVAQVAKAGGDGAYKLLWTREDDIQGGFYRPLTVHRLRAGLDAEGRILGWENTIANQTIVGGTPFEGFIRDGIDPMAVEGARNMPYAWPANRLAWVPMESPVSVLWWRSVGHTHTAYATETFLDELLAAGGQDPVAGRLALMKPGFERLAGALEKVAELADWQGPKGSDGRAFGVAVHKSFDSYAATIAEVSDNEGVPRVHRVWCAIDCGVAINPNVIRAQIEGGIGYGLSAAMFNEITLAEGGEIEQRNFDTYRLLRIDEMPAVEVAVVKSGEAPTGVGEPGLPPIAPAVANAHRTLTGKTPRQLPFSRLNA